MDRNPIEAKQAEKQRAMWIVLGALAVAIGLVLWMTGRSKDKAFSVDALRRRFFGGNPQG